jgi:predicted aspartyl protease
MNLVNQKEAHMIKKTIRIFLTVLLLNFAALAQVEDSPVKGVIPFELKEHLIVIKGKIDDSQEQYNFALDTGALTFIDRKVAEELGLKIRGNMAKINALEMGEVTIPKIFAFMGFNLDEFKMLGVTLHGIIGSNLLERFEVTLDYRKQRVILSPDKEVAGKMSKGFRLKFTNHPVNYAPMIDCKINSDISIKAMVDTGQPYSIVFPLVYLDKLGARNSNLLVKSKGVIIKWPGTSTTDSYLWPIDQFEQQNLKINDLMCCFAELPPLFSVPLLGKDYLCQFLITIDYPNDEILFVPYEDAKFIKNKFSFGINLIRGDKNTIVVDGLWTGGPADKAGIKVGDEIVHCNSTPLHGDDIFKVRQLIKNEDVKEIILVVMDKEGQREVSLHKEMLLK